MPVPANHSAVPASLTSATNQLTVALVGQPNCGKSTIFNRVVGYRSETANFPGSTVEVSQGDVRLNGITFRLMDVPGIYSLTTSNPAEATAKRLLLSSEVGLIINVLDASLLSRSLELTLELLESGIPMVVCLNMMDDAERKGISISAAKLSQSLGVPVFETIASRGEGVRELFYRAKAHRSNSVRETLSWSRDVESAIRGVESTIDTDGLTHAYSPPFVAAKLLEGDPELAALANEAARIRATQERDRLEISRGRSAESIIMAERHDQAMRLYEEAAVVGRPKPDVRFLLDSVLTHPVLGYLFLVVIFLALFWGVFGIGSLLEGRLQPLFAAVSAQFGGWLRTGSLGEALARSLWDGFAGGAAIVLPYLVPFLFGLAFLEDVGYLPRVAYLMDGLLHRIGLHGTSVLPFLLGYGCSVPACMATRILSSRRDRFIASVLATLVPCSARSNVIFALVAFYLGPIWALGIFCFNALVVVLSGWVLTRIWPEVSPGMVLDVPRYQMPRLSVMTHKVWFRLREFLVVSWPLLVLGSAVLGLAEHWHLQRAIDAMLSPLTSLLGLPVVVGTTLVFGLLRKELSIIMLVQALGTTHVNQVMSATQILVFTIFVSFYIPCLATIATLVKEIGRKLTAMAIAYSFAVATLLAVAARFALAAVLR
jgi:ferrous iron transport protein B